MNTLAQPPHSALAESLVFTRRIFRHWRRSPVVPVQSVLFPLVMLVTYYLLISRSMARVTGTDKLDVLVAICAIGGGMSGALGSAMTLPQDRKSGLISRVWTLPIRRSSLLTGALLAEAARTFVCTVLTLLLGLTMGFRFGGTWYQLIVFALLPSLVVVIFTMMVTAITVKSQNGSVLTWMAMAVFGMVFGSAVPAEMAPGLLQPLMRNQPMAVVIDSMRSMANAQPAAVSLLIAVCWFVLLGAVFGPFAVRRCRAAAESA